MACLRNVTTKLAVCPILLTLLLGTGTAQTPAAAPASTSNALAQVEAALAEVRTVRTRFTQEKRLALFKKPLLTTGIIALEMPDKLLWRVETPLHYALLLDGRHAQQWDGETGRNERIRLDSNPVFAAVTTQLRAWFSGRYASLAGEYEISQRAPAPLVLAFAPRADTPPAALLREVVVTFRDDNRYIASIVITENSGDVTTLKFAETVINQPLPLQEWQF